MDTARNSRSAFLGTCLALLCAPAWIGCFEQRDEAISYAVLSGQDWQRAGCTSDESGALAPLFLVTVDDGAVWVRDGAGEPVSAITVSGVVVDTGALASVETDADGVASLAGILPAEASSAAFDVHRISYEAGSQYLSRPALLWDEDSSCVISGPAQESGFGAGTSSAVPEGAGTSSAVPEGAGTSSAVPEGAGTSSAVPKGAGTSS